jgi:hypothetical protein
LSIIHRSKVITGTSKGRFNRSALPGTLKVILEPASGI